MPAPKAARPLWEFGIPLAEAVALLFQESVRPSAAGTDGPTSSKSPRRTLALIGRDAGSSFLARRSEANPDQKAELTPERRGWRPAATSSSSAGAAPLAQLPGSSPANAARPAHEYLYSLDLVSASLRAHQSPGAGAEPTLSQGSAFLKEVCSVPSAVCLFG
jgi:hypothetical protein